MIGNVQILKNNGDTLVSNGLARFILNDSQKQFIIYTLGEQNGEYIKTYIGLENAPVTDEGITEAEGDFLSELLRKIGKNEDISSLVTFLPLTSDLYHIHDKVKKVAVPNKIFNNIIALQQQSQIKTNFEDTPVIKENTFFNSSDIAQQKVEVSMQSEPSIFDQPIQPVIETTEGGEKPTNSNIESNGKMIESSQTSNYPSEALEQTGELITDEQAKRAIKSVEEAQEIIAENVKLIKLFISQQNSLNNKLTIENKEESVKQDDILLNNEVSNNPETINDGNAVTEKIDVVKNIELAPQPAASLDVLVEESDLENNYAVDATSQIDATINAENSLNSSEAVSSGFATNAPNNESKSIENGAQKIASQPLESVQYIDTTSMLQPESSSNYVQQIAPESATSFAPQSDTIPEYIDTTAMINQPSISSIQNSEQNMGAKPPVIDTGDLIENNEGMHQSVNESQTMVQPESFVIDNALTGINYKKVAENPSGVQQSPAFTAPVLNQTQDVNERQNYGFATQMPIPEVQNTNQQLTDEQNENKTNQGYTDVGTLQPEYQETVIQFPNKEPQTTNNAGEFSIPPIDMNTDIEQISDVTPVVIPDGQTAELEQSLVLTPEAFKTAA